MSGNLQWLRDPYPTRGTADFEYPSFLIQHLWLCRAVLQGRHPVPEGTEAKVQHQVLRPDEGVVSMPSGRAVPLLSYGMCARVAKQRGSVNVSSAGIRFAVAISNIKLVGEGTLTWNSTWSSKGDF